MDLVLGLSMTSTALRWVLVEGTTGEGDTIDRGAIDIAADPDAVLDTIAAAGEPYAVGVTWTDQAEDAASTVLEALAARGLENVIAVSELEAADLLAAGIADIAAYDDAAVCIVEPDAALVAIVTPEGVTVDRIDRPLDGDDALELASSVLAMLDLDDWRPDAIFVVGSADGLDLIVSTLDGVTSSPVISAAEADLALARGAALASARAVNALDARVTPRWRQWTTSRAGALTSVLAAAVVTLVVSLSVALGLRLTPGTAAEEPAAVASSPSVAQAGPDAQRPAARPRLPAAARPATARAVVAKTIVVAVPPPVYEPVAPPPAALPPAPAYVPPAPPPNYVPPVAPEPRLRDRIIERIPIINRFHEPEPQYPRR